MQVRADDVRREPGREHRLRHLEVERARPMRDVEQHPPLPCGPTRVPNPAIRRDRRVRKRPKAMCQRIAGPQLGHHVGIARRRLIDVTHHRQSGPIRRLDRVIQRHDPVDPAGIRPDPHLDAADQVGVRQRDGRAVRRIHQPQIEALAEHHRLGEREDAGMAHVQIGQDPRLARRHHVLPKASEVPRTRRPGIDPRRRPRPPRQHIRIDADRRPAPIHVRMKIDVPRHHETARDVPLPRSGQPGADRRYHAARERHVGHLVPPGPRVDHPPTAKHEFVCHTHYLKGVCGSDRPSAPPPASPPARCPD